MKKTVLVLSALCMTAVGFSQLSKKWEFKVGISTPLPADVDNASNRISVGSVASEVSTPIYKKISAVGNVMYIKCVNVENSRFSQIPVMVGAKYAIDKNYYFGVSTGVTFYNKKEVGSGDFIYSPYIGMQTKRISVDMRYFNTVRPDAIRFMGLVFSYTL